MAATTSESVDILGSIFSTIPGDNLLNATPTPEEFLIALHYLRRDHTQLFEEATRIDEVYWKKNRGCSGHETITLSRRFPASTGDIILERVPPHTSWFNVWLFGQADDRFSLSAPNQPGPGDTIWQCVIPNQNNYKFYVWEVILLARIIHNRFPNYTLVSHNCQCFLFAGYFIRVLRRYLQDESKVEIPDVTVGGTWGSSRVFVPKEKVVCQLLGEFKNEVNLFRASESLPVPVPPNAADPSKLDLLQSIADSLRVLETGMRMDEGFRKMGDRMDEGFSKMGDSFGQLERRDLREVRDVEARAGGGAEGVEKESEE